MPCLRSFSALVLGSCLAVTGCVVDAQEPLPFEDADLEVPLEETGFGVLNGITPACFWDHGVQAALRSLATGPIANSTGYMPSMASVPAPCWKVIKDTVECALPATMSVRNVNNGDIYNGLVGLAAGWRTGSLGGPERRWVTACLIQRLNAFGIEVPTLQEGNHPAMYTNAADDALYPFDESTGSGDLFSSTMPLGGNSPAFLANMCSETDLNKICRDREGTLDYRICDTAGPLCGLNYLGPCNTACVPNGPYWTCLGNSQTVRVQLQTGACH
jgi:hypothetical protein